MRECNFKYDDAHFASTLLECGPHIPQQHDFDESSYQDYRDRVYSHFFAMFPSYGNIPGSVQEGPAHEWHVFWGEYRRWVEGDPWSH